MKVRLSSAQKIQIRDSKDVYSIMQAVLLRQNKMRRKQEYFWTLGLSNHNDIDYLELTALGRLNAVNVEPVEVLSFAVQKRCKRIILIHNHPAGKLKPSKSDIIFTALMQKASALLKITLHDHLIISETDYFSFADDGLI